MFASMRAFEPKGGWPGRTRAGVWRDVNVCVCARSAWMAGDAQDEDERGK